MIFNIQRYSIHDGAGIRTVIFFKGCPLRCQWCCNPESHTFGYSILYNREICRDFGDCIRTEPRAIFRGNSHGVRIDRGSVADPSRLIDLCPAKALTVAGESKSVEDLLLEIDKDAPFYREDGGVTLSGGEPLSQGNELDILLERLRERNINVNAETSLHVKWREVDRCIGLVDTFLVDLKHTDRDKYKTYIQGDAALVTDNLKRLADSGARVVIRIPVVPGFNHTEKEMNRLIDFVATLKVVQEIHFLPYHAFGAVKYDMLGLDDPFRDQLPVRDSEIGSYQNYAESKGFKTRMGG